MTGASTHPAVDPVLLAPAARAMEVIGGDLTEKSLRTYLEGLAGVDAVGLEARAASLGTRSIKTTSKAWALDAIIRMIDLTTLEGADTPGKVQSLVAKALTPDPSDLTTPRVAAVCVYGDMVQYARAALGTDSGVNVAAVATAFPSGRAALPIKLADTRDAVAAEASLGNRWRFCWQSAGHEPGEWMSPDFADLLPELAARGDRAVLVAPVQFLSAHLEVLYDIDVAAREQAEACGLAFHRAPTLDTDARFIAALANVARRTLGGQT